MNNLNKVERCLDKLEQKLKVETAFENENPKVKEIQMGVKHKAPFANNITSEQMKQFICNNTMANFISTSYGDPKENPNLLNSSL
jgi:hypothetical protein